MPRKIPGPKINPQKSHAEFPSLKNYQALHCKRYNPKDNNSREREGKKTFAELRGRETQALPRIFTFF